jgi:serine/threonine-protein kinase haspin
MKSSTGTPRKQVSWTEKECYECLVEVEAVLGAYIHRCRAKKKKKGKKVGQNEDVTTRMGSAGDVRRWGVGRGWVK